MMNLIKLVPIAFIAICAIAGAAFAQEQAEVPPPREAGAMDTPNDAGGRLLVWWKMLERDSEDMKYVVEVSESSEGPFEVVAQTPGRTNLCSGKPSYFGLDREKNENFQFVEIKLTEKEPEEKGQGSFKGENGKEYFFRVKRVEGDKESIYSGTVSASASPSWFNTSKIYSFVLAILFCVIIFAFINIAKKNPNLFIRRIAGLEAVEEAIGRATEMGKPIFYLTGLQPMSELPTIASVNILGQVAKKVADHDTTLKVPNRDPIVMSVCQEVIKESFTSVGRPDAYNEDDVFFITQDQFAFTAAVDGMMVREKPATVFLMGYFYAESLLLTEVGSSIGAIQIAGTDAYVQLPFFITTCDYVLIGEELYAASAYLSREPALLGSLRGQDVGKAFLVAVIIIGIILTSLGSDFIVKLLTEV